MTPQERELLSTFLQQLKQTQAGLKDSEAEALIREACALQPDAAYLLVQRTMGLDFAVQAAQAQIDKLQAQTDKLQAELEPLRASAKPASSSFLDSPNVWGRQAAPLSPAPPAPASRPAMQPAAGAAAPVAQTPAPASAPASAWGSGILGSVATTAAGVVAGTLLYQGIQGLMGHHTPAMAAAPVAPPALPDPVAPAQIARQDDPPSYTQDNSGSTDDTYYADSDDSGSDDSDFA